MTYIGSTMIILQQNPSGFFRSIPSHCLKLRISPIAPKLPDAAMDYSIDEKTASRVSL